MKNRKIRATCRGRLRLPCERRATKSGFTFLEVMISLLLLMIGIVFLIDLFPIALKNFKKSKDITMATFLVQQKMEEIRNLSADQSVPCAMNSPDSSDSNFRYTIGERSWPFDGSEDYKEVKVKVAHLISGAHAEASTVKKSAAKIGGSMFILSIQATSGARSYMLAFSTKPKSSEIYYTDYKYAYSGNFSDNSSAWKSLGCLPSGEAADQINAGVCNMSSNPSAVSYPDSGEILVYASDKKGNLYASAYSLNVGACVNLNVIKGWTLLKYNAPCMPQ